MVLDTLTTPAELKAILDSVMLARQTGASLFVELGVKRAGTSWRVRKVLERTKGKAHLLGVDIDPRASGMWHRRMKKPKNGAAVTWAFELSTTREAAARRPGAACAWVFVDACHCIECTTADIDEWGAMIVPGGCLVVHDTTPRRRHYTKPFQHGGTRRFGVWEAVEASEKSGTIARMFRKLWDVDDRNGVRVYVRESDIRVCVGEGE